MVCRDRLFTGVRCALCPPRPPSGRHTLKANLLRLRLGHLFIKYNNRNYLQLSCHRQPLCSFPIYADMKAIHLWRWETGLSGKYATSWWRCQPHLEYRCAAHVVPAYVPSSEFIVSIRQGAAGGLSEIFNLFSGLASRLRE